MTISEPVPSGWVGIASSSGRLVVTPPLFDRDAPMIFPAIAIATKYAEFIHRKWVL